MATDVKEVLFQALGSKSKDLDDTVIDYVCGMLEDVSLRSDVDELANCLSPFLIDSGVIQDEEEGRKLCESISSNFQQGKSQNTAKKLQGGTINIQKIEGNGPDLSSIFDPKERASQVDKDKLQYLNDKKQKQRALKLQKEQAKKDNVIANQVAQDFIMNQNVGADNKGSKDIKVLNFSLTYGKLELLQDTDMTLAYGRRYGLIGRNGTGKTTLMRAFANREIPEIPSRMSILHVEQEAVGDDTSVIDSVLKADVQRYKLLQLEKQLLHELEDPNLTKDSKETFELQLNSVYKDLEHIGADSAVARASSILNGLGFDHPMQQQATKEYSGGWRMRVALARALFSEPDLLLLDEPTNHLDLFSCIWLENYLQGWKGTVVVVSHQRDFLNAVATDIMHLHNKKLTHYKGNYDVFEQVRYERLLQQQRAYESQQKQVKHIQKFIDRFRYNANRAALVQSRLKAIERMQLVNAVEDDPTLVLNFPDPEELIPPILQFWDVSFGYDSSKPLFQNLNLGVDLESRIALLGPNGAGKSTLLKLMAGELQATSGSVVRHPKLRFAKFSQHFVDQLGDFNVSPLEHFMASFPGVPAQNARSHLGSFGLSGDLALRSIGTLSGGQKSRLVFAMLSWKKPHVLLLDEPTNHLDIETIDSLCEALNVFKGGVLLISHDERLISMVCDQIWYLNDRKVAVYDGEYTNYKKLLLSSITNQDRQITI